MFIKLVTDNDGDRTEVHINTDNIQTMYYKNDKIHITYTNGENAKFNGSSIIFMKILHMVNKLVDMPE